MPEIPFRRSSILKVLLSRMPPDPTIGDYPSLKSSTAPDLTVHLVAKQYFLLLETASDLSNKLLFIMVT